MNFKILLFSFRKNNIVCGIRPGLTEATGVSWGHRTIVGAFFAQEYNEGATGLRGMTFPRPQPSGAPELCKFNSYYNVVILKNVINSYQVLGLVGGYFSSLASADLFLSICVFLYSLPPIHILLYL